MFVIPETVPWTELWVEEAAQKLKALRSDNRFASLVFVADPSTLWRQITDHADSKNGDRPWVSLLQWSDGFLRHWLEEQQLQLDAEDRRRLARVTGLWPRLITDLAGECNELRKLRERLLATENLFNDETGAIRSWRGRLGLDVVEPSGIISVLAQLDEPVSSGDLAIIAEADLERVTMCLRWGELLGIVRRQGTGYWAVDPVASRILCAREA